MEARILEELKDLKYTPIKPDLNKSKELKKILIVEDDMTLFNLLTMVLEANAPGAEIHWATSGEEAEYYINDTSYNGKPYDLAIVDIFLEGAMTGLDVWKLCDFDHPETNVLITSSMPFDKFVSCLTYEQACPPYLAKPFSISECIDAIGEFQNN